MEIDGSLVAYNYRKEINCSQHQTMESSTSNININLHVDYTHCWTLSFKLYTYEVIMFHIIIIG